MKTTGIFTTHYYEIPVKTINEPIYLIPFGDVHRSSPHCAVDRWLEFCEWAARKKNCYFIGMGDYDDLASTSERAILSDEKLHESTKKTLEEVYLKNTMRFAKEIGFMKGKIIGLIEGNHYATFPSGITTTQKMADILQCKYLGVLSFTRLAFKYLQTSSAVDIYAHHGTGAARLVGGSLNKVQQMAEAAIADIYLMGHDHKKASGTLSRMSLEKGAKDGGLRVKQKKSLVVRTGSFLRGLVEDEASYIADMAVNPTDLGVAKIEMTPRRNGSEDGNRSLWVDLHVSI